MTNEQIKAITDLAQAFKDNEAQLAGIDALAEKIKAVAAILAAPEPAATPEPATPEPAPQA